MGRKRSSLGEEFRYLGMCAYVTCYNKLDESRCNAKLYTIMKSIDECFNGYRNENIVICCSFKQFFLEEMDNH